MILKGIQRTPDDPLYSDVPYVPATQAEFEASRELLRRLLMASPVGRERLERYGEAWLSALAGSCPKLAPGRRGGGGTDTAG